MIVVTAPTGQIGRQLLDTLLTSGRPIRVIARDPSRLPAHTRKSVEIVQGSHSDADVVTRAFAGADVVFWLAPPNPHAVSVDAAYLDFTRPACDAIEKHGVSRVVGISALGRGVALGRNAGLVTAALAMDDLIASTGVHYRALAMPGFMDNMLLQVEAIRNQGTFFSTLSGDRRHPTCATRGIAAVATRLLLDDSWTGQDDVPVLGPEDLSQNGMAKIMSEVLERPIRHQQIPGEAFKATLTEHGMSDAIAKAMLDIMTAKDNGLDNAEPRTP
ncbi:NAD(P)H-binding protein [Candidatus Frankia alpina]|uniref:NAD(P)H-binding protein n=1 Tax=Candidatus Frankia alpina TaxID=2699483 RepID=UPI001F400D2F|nr:NAD(P)H-binding protein [Candidatus Frankia alpina]